MKVVVGSTNKIKIASVKDAFDKFFVGQPLEINGVDVDSGISDHPTTGEESIKGAINRAEASRKKAPRSDYFIGMEGGLLNIGHRYWEIGWIAVIDRSGNLSTALSPGLEIKGRLLEMILGGIELSLALEQTLGLKDVGKKSGFYGLATDGNLDRQRAYAEGVTFALAQFKHPDLFC